ncbi:crotonobetainyl-CoA:carnitine CoA-transferase CaiB-like acyl-CoA transferase [Pseudonocardia sediminis]|uniref:Crotonobetainyl-CoA:carnitine CoA-transferase CaiB-like acyl-CoA transferase n=1 Tax=Pseudonocardia sediminis TaxID=1397368 RepID=A0A4Q7UPL3_PSEST|nr:CoA transferase [Pseudonocardia sediminis]RZT83456.1 crotonobetainyl-CoA:carnitine CoA-transferase CaiB-like acyl-CoA transferase [Pseudonocardia sediminis]
MRPLEDVRIVSLEQYGAGPFGTMHLAELGAEIVKIEDPSAGGDVGRSVPPYAADGDSLFFQSFNRDKTSITLDIRTPQGREVFHDLVRSADAVYSNLRGDVPEKLGIRYDDLKDVNPRIVCCSLTGFGMTGPRSREPGYDYVLQALAGWMSLTGEPGGPPQKTGLSLVDYSGGYAAALSLLGAVHAARRDGVGTDCDVSLYDTAVSLLTYPGAWHMTAGYEPVRTSHSAHPSLIPFQAFEAADGWLVVAAPKEKFWQRLTVVMDRPDLAGDPRFATFADRNAHRDEILPILEGIFRTRTVADWLAPLYAASIPCAPIHDVAGALTDPHTVERDLVAETPHPDFGTVRTLRSPVRVGPPGDDRAPTRAAPGMGEHTETVLRGLGYDDDKIAALRRSGALGAAGAEKEI